MSKTGSRGRSLGAGAVLILLVGAAAAAFHLGRVRELPDFEPSPGERVEVALGDLGLVGRWPAMDGPWQHGWEVSQRGGTVVVQPRCAPPGEICVTRHPQPSLTLGPEGTVVLSEETRQLVGPGDRRLVYEVRTREGFRECSSTLVGRFTVGGRTLDVACGYTVEEGCGGGGTWCLPYLRHLEEATSEEDPGPASR